MPPVDAGSQQVVKVVYKVSLLHTIGCGMCLRLQYCTIEALKVGDAWHAGGAVAPHTLLHNYSPTSGMHC
jgi:hypothetical protein